MLIDFWVGGRERLGFWDFCLWRFLTFCDNQWGENDRNTLSSPPQTHKALLKTIFRMDKTLMKCLPNIEFLLQQCSTFHISQKSRLQQGRAKDILLCFIHFLTVMTNACIRIETSSKNIYKKGHSVDFEWHQPPLFSWHPFVIQVSQRNLAAWRTGITKQTLFLGGKVSIGVSDCLSVECLPSDGLRSSSTLMS